MITLLKVKMQKIQNDFSLNSVCLIGFSVSHFNSGNLIVKIVKEVGLGATSLSRILKYKNNCETSGDVIVVTSTIQCFYLLPGIQCQLHRHKTTCMRHNANQIDAKISYVITVLSV